MKENIKRTNRIELERKSKGMNRNKKIANMAMLVAVAMIFSYVESLIPINFGVPGMKLGVANLVTVTGI